MRCIASSFLVVMVLSPVANVHAQPVPSATASATVAARPADVASADAIIVALYDANTVIVDRSRTRTVPLALRTRRPPDADSRTSRPGGSALIRVQTSTTTFVRRRPACRDGFSEREIARTSESFGNIMRLQHV